MSDPDVASRRYMQHKDAPPPTVNDDRSPTRPARATDRKGRALVGVVAPDGDAFRATITADGATVYDRSFPTAARARVALRTSLSARATARRRRRPTVRVARRRDRP